MKEKDTIKIYATDKNIREELELERSAILYVKMDRNNGFIHMANGEVYQTRMTFQEYEELLGRKFIRLNRGCLVAAMAIYSVTDKITLCNGETLKYAVLRKKEILERIHEMQEEIIQSFQKEGIPQTKEEYREHYRVFDRLPVAFTDIEMVFNPECHAIDWIFRYGNPALAELEKLPLDTLIGNRFGKLFPNMDGKWLRSYERVAVYRETLEIIDYSPEIDTHLTVICFPTFEGHCGCILFDISKMHFFRDCTDTEKAIALLVDKILKGG